MEHKRCDCRHFINLVSVQLWKSVSRRTQLLKSSVAVLAGMSICSARNTDSQNNKTREAHRVPVQCQPFERPPYGIIARVSFYSQDLIVAHVICHGSSLYCLLPKSQRVSSLKSGRRKENVQTCLAGSINSCLAHNRHFSVFMFCVYCLLVHAYYDITTYSCIIIVVFWKTRQSCRCSRERVVNDNHAMIIDLTNGDGSTDRIATHPDHVSQG